MANVKISDLTAASALDGTELLEVVQGGTNKKATGAQVKTYIGAREKLTANRTYYVLNSGSDSNTGLVNSAGGAFATLQKAYDTILTIDLAGFTASIVYGTSGQTITNVLNCAAPPVGGNVTLDLGGSTISATSATCITNSAPFTLTVQNGTLTTTTSGNCLFVNGKSARITVGASITFGASASRHIGVFGGSLNFTANYSITGAAPVHILTAVQGLVEYGSLTVTITGTPAFSSQTMQATGQSQMSIFVVTWSGAATGTRYLVDQNSVINVYGAGTSHLPGNAAGSTASGGQYV
jgi:hypothetical protein